MARVMHGGPVLKLTQEDVIEALGLLRMLVQQHYAPDALNEAMVKAADRFLEEKVCHEAEGRRIHCIPRSFGQVVVE